MLLGNIQQFKFYQWPSEILPLDPFLSHLNLVTPLHHYFRSILIIYPRLYLGVSVGSYLHIFLPTAVFFSSPSFVLLSRPTHLSKPALIISHLRTTNGIPFSGKRKQTACYIFLCIFIIMKISWFGLTNI